jgi:hypothetical protein
MDLMPQCVINMIFEYRGLRPARAMLPIRTVASSDAIKVFKTKFGLSSYARLVKKVTRMVRDMDVDVEGYEPDDPDEDLEETVLILIECAIYVQLCQRL